MNQLTRWLACALLGAWCCIGISRVVSAKEAVLRVVIVDEAGRPTSARVWATQNGERLFEPTDSPTATVYARDRSFSCDGEFTMKLSPGMVTVHVEKGKEYRPINDTFMLQGAEQQRTLKLARWVDMPSRGWYSADMHVHLGFDNPRVLKQLALADDVHLMPAFTYWLRGGGDRWQAEWPAGIDTTPVQIDASHWITRNNLEIERIQGRALPGHSVGATFLFNLTRPVTAARHGEFFPTDARLCEIARQDSPQSVFDSDKPSWAETPVGAALGLLDTVQVCHNHYHRTATLPGGWGMIGPLSAGESNTAVGDGLFHRTNALYYRLLNCGFRLGVSGGSAIGVMPVPTGYNRVYARIDGAFTADKMWEAIRTGRSFATSGPMLDLTLGDATIGDTVRVETAGQQSLVARAMVESIDELEALQIVSNGRVVASKDLRSVSAEPHVRDELIFEWTPLHGGWIAARALFRAPDGLLRQAHTSPIYVDVEGQRFDSPEDARYMLRWVQTLIEIAQTHPDRYPDAAAQEAVLEIYRRAAAVYKKLGR